jgi:hypothetical protein
MSLNDAIVNLLPLRRQTTKINFTEKMITNFIIIFSKTIC